jgi:hypothetical protein
MLVRFGDWCFGAEERDQRQCCMSTRKRSMAHRVLQSARDRIGHMSSTYAPLNAATASATVPLAGVIGPGNFWFGREMELNWIEIHRWQYTRPPGMHDA